MLSRDAYQRADDRWKQLERFTQKHGSVTPAEAGIPPEARRSDNLHLDSGPAPNPERLRVSRTPAPTLTLAGTGSAEVTKTEHNANVSI